MKPCLIVQLLKRLKAWQENKTRYSYKFLNIDLLAVVIRTGQGTTKKKPH